MDWRLLGIGGKDSDPWDTKRSRTKQDASNKNLGRQTSQYLRTAFVPFLRSELPDAVRVSVSDSVDQGVVIRYPAVYRSDYVQDGVLLEIGPPASWVPWVWKTIVPEVSRHYYDIVMLSRAGVAEAALRDLPLLQSVAEFKERFYPSRVARYDLARPGAIRLLPDEAQLTELARDYRRMETMFYGSSPEWQVLVDELRALERTLNDLEGK